MTTGARPAPGSIVWTDLTVPNAGDIRDFYVAVTGWQPEAVAMGGYSDFNMVAPSTGAPAAGICHARGENANLPPHWVIYIVVDDVDRAAATCVERGGQIVDGPRGMSGGRFCVIRDPAGAVCALYTPAQ